MLLIIYNGMVHATCLFEKSAERKFCFVKKKSSCNTKDSPIPIPQFSSTVNENWWIGIVQSLTFFSVLSIKVIIYAKPLMVPKNIWQGFNEITVHKNVLSDSLRLQDFAVGLVDVLTAQWAEEYFYGKL